ncbi:FHF complex subunit HOOK-interacting protein 2B [Denticeps clupeoides]|uniref:FHF complex subunit HOOK-interacting protein C-terminal domain-containing protein n=1 Tax=Denticeps clupeoides TaxID=299321 RepID=A0AAY4DH62_9TELE|nr:protein FAM160B2-like [Denticeps clupeoides]
MEVLGKLTALLQQALETREPEINLLDSFVDHWKGITNYYIETTDEYRPVKDTDIPWRLKQMLDILVYEEQQQQLQQEDTGPCMEYLLQHKVMETLCTLGKAEYPPGMIQQVLVFFTKVLSQVQKPLLHIINVYRPVQKLIALCGLPSSQTEKEEAHFMFVVCSRVKKDPNILSFILEKEPRAATPGPNCEGERGFIQTLTKLTQSTKSRVVQHAMESLVLLVSGAPEDTGRLLLETSPLCQLLSQRLCDLYKLIPCTLDPSDLQMQQAVQWRDLFNHQRTEESPSSPDSGHVTRFFCWLDFCDHLITHAPIVLSAQMARSLHNQWLTGVVQPQLLQMSEAGVLVHTTLLSCIARHTHSSALLGELILFLLGDDTEPEQRSDNHTHTLRYSLIQNCDHISDEISIATLRLFEELLQKPDKRILSNLALRNLERRCYATPMSSGVSMEERQGGAAESDVPEESEELEEDPFFSDALFSESEFGGVEPLSSRPCPPVNMPQAESVNSFLCLVPQEAKTSQHVPGTGYDTYVHDAYKMFKETSALCIDWGWPENILHSDMQPSAEFYEGHFLHVLFNRLGRILEQPYELNLQVTSVLSRISLFPHPHLHEYLLDPFLSLSPGGRSLFSALVRVIGELMQRIEHIPNISNKLVHIRKQLMGQEDETLVDHVTLLRGVIVLEEFCKELAAIAFIKLPTEAQ